MPWRALGSFIKRQTSGTSSDNEWYEWQRMTTSNNEWYNEPQRMTTSDNEWQRMTKSEMTFQLIFLFFFQIKEEPTTKHPKEKFLHLEEDLWTKPIELRAETSTQKEILTARSRNWRSSCSYIFTKKVFLKNFAIFSF